MTGIFVFFCLKIILFLAFRRSLPLKSEEHSMTENYCKTEFRLSIAYHLSCYILIFPLFHGFVFFIPNAYHLPLNCYIFFLPPHDFFSWEFNYAAIALIATLIGLTIDFYVLIPFILMNQSCWLLDMALLTAETISDELHLDNLGKLEKANENIKNFIERCKHFVEWQNDVQHLLFWYFNLEFQVQALILCLSIYVLSFTNNAGMMFMVFIFCAFQIFALCWMGTRVKARIGKLSYGISKNWYLMTPRQRKSLQIILHWIQNMKSFTGLFKDVNLETCKTVRLNLLELIEFLNLYLLRFLKLRSPSILFYEQPT